MKTKTGVLFELLALLIFVVFLGFIFFWSGHKNHSNPLKAVQGYLTALNKPLVKVEVFNQRPMDELGRPTIFPDKENKIYAFLFRGMVGSTNFDEKTNDYLHEHPEDAVLVSYTGANAEKSILVFTDSTVPDPEYFRVSRR